MADAQARVQALLDDLVARDVERGVQVAAYLDGRQVIDAWAGVADQATGRPVDGDTLFCTFSVIKGVTATAIHLLAERGQLDYDTPVAACWPAFAVSGKGRITPRHILSHSAGIPQLPDGLAAADLCDWDAVCQRVAQLEPLWEPGAATGYHAITFGWVLGELVRRIDGRPIERFVQEEICAPLGITSLYLGIPDAVEPRVAVLEPGPPPPWPPPADSLYRRVLPAALEPLHELANRGDVRRAVLPASGGIMNARAIARHYAAMVGDGLDGVRLLGPTRLRQATTLQTEEVDQVLRYPVPKALGYFLGGRLSRVGARRAVFGHEGAGGAIGLGDAEHRFAIGIAKNRLADGWIGQETSALIIREARDALGIADAGERVTR
ncbi:MAG TPA: serine hydrolase domain-containing protein [Roseiflexaceae bacterium]